MRTALFVTCRGDTLFPRVGQATVTLLERLAAAGALVCWAEHGEPFAAAVEQGVLAATQFHPEKSGDAGAALLANWLETLT